MEFEQLVKRIEWLDEEHRKTRAAITRLEERMAAMEANIDTVAKQLRPLPKQIAEVASTAARLDQFDAIFAKQRDDMSRRLCDTLIALCRSAGRGRQPAGARAGMCTTSRSGTPVTSRHRPCRDFHSRLRESRTRGAARWPTATLQGSPLEHAH